MEKLVKLYCDLCVLFSKLSFCFSMLYANLMIFTITNLCTRTHVPTDVTPVLYNTNIQYNLFWLFFCNNAKHVFQLKKKTKTQNKNAYETDVGGSRELFLILRVREGERGSLPPILRVATFFCWLSSGAKQKLRLRLFHSAGVFYVMKWNRITVGAFSGALIGVVIRTRSPAESSACNRICRTSWKNALRLQFAFF